jgi:hypothetical protein
MKPNTHFTLSIAELKALPHILKMITEIGLSGGRGKLRYVLPVTAVAQGRTI